jgi:hypothetical protein
VIGVPAQAPPVHASFVVHPLPSLQLVPSGAFELEQAPVVGLQVPATWHGPLAVQATGFEPVHVPPAHAYAWLQRFVPVQAVPSGAVGFEQAPVAVLQVPMVWQASCAVQTTGLLPAQTPAWQESLRVHALPSLQAAPFARAGFEQVPFAGLQVPAEWHWSSAVHVTGFEPVQTPAWHESACVQALPSLHAVPFARGRTSAS